MEAPQKEAMVRALREVALHEARRVAKGLAEIITYLEAEGHLAALGTYEGLDEQFTFLGTVLKAAARLPRT